MGAPGDWGALCPYRDFEGSNGRGTMELSEFLHAVWPAEGLYALATPFKPAGATKSVYAHKVFESIDHAAAYAHSQRDKVDLYFCVHTLAERRVWDATKKDWKTGELGAWAVRTHGNALSSRCFFFDLDVGARTGKYPDQRTALEGLRKFCAAAQLPKPLITSSGGGLHVYWRMSEAMPSTEWVAYASKLRQLARHHGLLADPARTTDVSSVLRVTGTFNWKDRENPRPVKVLAAGPQTGTGELLRLIDEAVTRGGIEVRTTPLLALPAHLAELNAGGNIEANDFDGPPVSMKALITVCKQVQRAIRLKADVSEPEFYHLANVIRFTENGVANVHKLAAMSLYYDPNSSWTDDKLEQLTSKGIKPSSCYKLAEVCGDEACEGCAFAGKVKSPIVAARFKDPAPAPAVTRIIGDLTITTEIPDPPKPYTRLKGGGVSFLAKDKDGEEVHTTIYENDLYPVRRLVNEASETEQQVWRVELPRSGGKDFVLDADALYDRRKFMTAIANHGIYPDTGNIPYVQEYMVHYIKLLQGHADAEAQCNHLGWIDDQQSFILPDKIISKDGVKPAHLSLGAKRATMQVHKAGTLERQVELLRFYDHPAYIAHQFYVLCGLAAPIFYATGHHGVIVNARGEAGSSKSTALYTACSMWGHPEQYPINGTNNGATVRARNERVSTLANLPVGVDEITHMPAKDAIDLAMSITQPGHRIRLDTSGIERPTTGSEKATIMIANANRSLHNLLSSDNAAGTAGSMRVVEMMFKPELVHTKAEADEFLRALKGNYGHIGEQFIAQVMRQQEAMADRVRALTKIIDAEADIQSSERFWSATIASVVTAGEIAREMGLISYDTAAIHRWAVEKLVPSMRGVVVEEYTTSIGTLANYLESIHGDILIVRRVGQQGLLDLVNEPKHQLLAHYDVDERVMWVLKKGFKDYCLRTGANFLEIIDELGRTQIDKDTTATRVISHKNLKKVLGAGTKYAKAQSWCFTINMAHPELTGLPDLTVAVDNVTKLKSA